MFSVGSSSTVIPSIPSLTLINFWISCFLVIFLLSISFLRRISSFPMSSPDCCTWLWLFCYEGFKCYELLSPRPPWSSFKKESTSVRLESRWPTLWWTDILCCLAAATWSKLSTGMLPTVWFCETLWWPAGRAGVGRSKEAGRIFWPTAP